MTKNDIAADSVIDDDKLYRRIGIAVIVAVFGGFGLWAALAPLSSAALAPGVITVENYRKTVQHLEGGIVKTIAVRDGDRVKKGQVLVVLDDTQPKAQLEVLKGQFFIALARESRLLAQQQGLDAVVYPSELTSYVADSRSRDAMSMQDHHFNVRKRAYEGEIDLYKRQIEELKARVRGLRAQKQSKERLVKSFQAELDDFKDLLKDGYAEKQKVREFERNLAQSQGERGELISSIAETELQISETKLKILQLSKDFQREVIQELGEVQAQLFEIREKIQSLQDTVTRTVITAPEAGMVMGLSIHTIGAVVPPGGEILDIVPQGEKLIVEAKVSPMDIDRVQVGQQAEVRFSAFKSRSTPKVYGTLIGLSADRIVDERLREQEPYYLARIEINPEGTQSLVDAMLELVPGMPAEVLINTGDRTMLQYLADPLKDTIARSFIED